MFKNITGSNAAGKNNATSDESFSGTVDPTGLERAAKAARDLDSSPNAQASLALVREQEKTKQSEFEAKTAELRAYEAQQREKNIEVQAEQQRKTIEKQAEYARGQEHYRDKLERERQKDTLGMQMQAQRQMKEEERKKDEESVLRQEAIRRKTVEYETALRQQADSAKAKAEAEGRIEQERRNHDLIMQQKRLELRESRKTTLEGIRVATSSIGAGLSSFVSDREKVTTAVGGLSLAALGVYSARAGATVMGGYIGARLGKPSLVRETSRITPISAVREPIATARKVYNRFSSHNADRALDGVVLASPTKTRLQRIARATKNSRKHQAPFRNVLLSGPPGTGKTLFAKGLAKESGLEYAIFTGGDLAPLGSSAVTELHKMFDWAQTSRKGLLLFIDEADAFLRTRSSAAGATEDMRNALNAFLYRTGQPTTRFMLMMATNRPHEFDEAAADRVDDVIPFSLPGPEQRREMLDLFVNRLIRRSAAPIELLGDEPWEQFWDEAVGGTEHFSGREMEKLVIGWQAAGYGNASAELAVDEARQVLRDHVHQKDMKESWARYQQQEGSRPPGYQGSRSVERTGADANGELYTAA